MAKKVIQDKPWFVYIARCSDETLYSGVAINVDKRIYAHNHTNKCRYTRSRKPIAAVYQEVCCNRGSALKREIEIKRLNRKAKLDLINKI